MRDVTVSRHLLTGGSFLTQRKGETNDNLQRCIQEVLPGEIRGGGRPVRLRLCGDSGHRPDPGGLYLLLLPLHDPPGVLLQELQHLSGGYGRCDHRHHPDHPLQRGGVSGHGGCPVHCPVPYRREGPHGPGVPLLVHQRGYYGRCRSEEPGGAAVRLCHSGHSDF